MSTLTGGCLCGAIRYTVGAPPALTAMCHCTHCQRQSGSAFSTNLGVPSAALQITQGQTKVYQDTGSSGQPVYRHFCGDCGSPIYSDVVAMPGLAWLKAGTLDDTSSVQPGAEVWCRSAQPWVMQPSQRARFDENPPRG